MALAYTGGSGGGGGGGGVQSVTAGDTSVVVGGTATNPTVAVGVVPLSDLADPGSGKVVGSGGGAAAAVFPPGFEIGYSQITTNANVTDTSESTATALITAGPFTFDGAPVIAEFFSPTIIADNNAATDFLVVTLFEGTTEIGRLGSIRTTVVGTGRTNTPMHCTLRFTPGAGDHTYKLCAFASSATGGLIVAGAGGTGGNVPTYLRFTKV